LIESKTIDEPSKIWWDIRPHHTFPTLEFRICDCCTRADEAISIAALVQALVAKMIQLRLNNQTWRKYRGSLISENKWRAIKGGVDSKLIDFGNQKEVTFINLFDEMLEFVDDVVDVLGSRKQLELLRTLVENGTSSDRQLKIFNKNNEINDVVDSLIEETLDGC
jgi:carboxylate-amine ligase